MSSDAPDRSRVMVFRADGNLQPENAPDWRPAAGIRLFLIVSRFEADHALTYLFCDNGAGVERVQSFVTQHPEQFRGNNIVVELGENFYSLAQAKQRALALRTWLTNVNVIFPPVQLT